ncbi:MAG: porin, partial [Candidatus Omnitrophica bacterium]|nr:porin [Candidatus Omnitrophota bacterium]
GIDFKIGKFVTLLGAEVIESPANWNSSRSYMFGFSIPFTHTGILASYPLGEWGSATGGVVNGWDIVDDNNKAKTLIGNVTLTPFEKLTLSFNGITGAEQAGDSNDKRSVFDLVATYQPMDKLTLMANYDVGHESGLAPASGGKSGIGWTGLALYAKYDLSPTWYLAGRWEWFDDKDNIRTGLTSFGGGTPPDVDFYEWTLTSQWTLHKHVLARLEYRHDFADQRVFFHDTDGFSHYQVDALQARAGAAGVPARLRRPAGLLPRHRRLLALPGHDCGGADLPLLSIADCGLSIADFQSEIRNPQFEIPEVV